MVQPDTSYVYWMDYEKGLIGIKYKNKLIPIQPFWEDGILKYIHPLTMEKIICVWG